MKNKITSNIKAIVLALVLTLGMGYVSAAWSDPTVAPPGGNVPAPINVGGQDGVDPSAWYSQTKTGALTLMHLFTPDLTVTSPNSTPVVPGQMLVAENSTGKVKWADVPPTQSVSCTFVGSSSSISLNGNNSGNNNGIVVSVGTLSSGTYTITGSGQTYSSGGGGWAGVVLSDTVPTYSQISSTLNSRWGTPATGVTGASYKFYYNSDNADTIVMNKRNGSNDGVFTVPSTSVTVSGTKYIYVVLGQAAISGSLSISGGQNVCAGGTTSSSSGDLLYYYDSVNGTVPPPSIFGMNSSSTKIPSTSVSQTGFTRGADFSLSGKTRVGAIASGHGGSRPYVILKTNKRTIGIETAYVRWTTSMDPVLIVNITAGTVVLGYEGGGGIFYKTINLDSGETPLTIRASGMVYDNAGSGEANTRLIYNQ